MSFLRMAPEPAASGEGQTIPQPRPVVETNIGRCGGESGGPSTPVQQGSSLHVEAKGDEPSIGSLPLRQTFYLKPSLLRALATVGATYKAYTFKEILGLLKKYIFQNKSLINAEDSRIINCGGTLLGEALGTDKLEYSQVRSLVLKNIFSSKELIYIPLPTIPEALSGPESEYSYQGYETAVCAYSDDSEEGTRSQGSEEEDEEIEYEIVTDIEKSGNDEDDSESDVESLVFILDVDAKSDLDEDFFADESHSSSDSDPELKQDQWSCLTCGIKNKPFRRYCIKCWKLRKDWYPDPSKRKRKRKPRPKKEKKRNSLEELRKMAAAEADTPDEDSKTEEFHSGLERTTSSYSTSTVASVSSGISAFSVASSSSAAASSQEFSLGSQSVYSSQDSGFASQDLGSSAANPRKRVFSESTEDVRSKVRRVSESTELSRKVPRKDLNKLYASSEGGRWLQSEEAKKILETISSDSEPEEEDRCCLCFVRPKNASIIHGRISHIAFCYPCAKKLHKSNSKCPICRRKIHMVTKNTVL